MTPPSRIREALDLVGDDEAFGVPRVRKTKRRPWLVEAVVLAVIFALIIWS